MLLYHGSKEKLEKLEKRQAGSEVEVPKDELLEAIYFTPNYGFAVACGARPLGMTDIDDEQKTIKFENPDLFDPEIDVFIYRIESENVPEGHLRQIDDHQYIVENMKEITFNNVDEMKASEVSKYYKLINWEPKEYKSEAKLKFR